MALQAALHESIPARFFTLFTLFTGTSPRFSMCTVLSWLSGELAGMFTP